ncbi:MAG: hypothetical protein HY403_08400 [Elusimicrobia bacterium]|nr:hypothetical protein [Elusimicrobiota bacterium]
MADSQTIWFRYRFTLDNGRQSVFEVRLDPETLTILRPANPAPPPDWTTLAYSPCEHCALPAEARHCPIAVNLSDVVKEFDDVLSFRSAKVVIETRERQYAKEGPVQELLFPLLGIYMSGSGCPSMEKFKPLLRHHLPFATSEETIYRVITMYVTAQYMRVKNGQEPDWELKGLNELYEQVNRVNKDFCRRLNKAVNEDAMVNSVIILDSLGYMVKRTAQKTEQYLNRVFAPYLKEPS